MGPIQKLATLRQRFNELAAAVGEARELSRDALLATRGVQTELGAVTARPAALESLFGQISAQIASLAESEQVRSEQERVFRSELTTSIRRGHADEAWHRRRLCEVRR